MSRNEFTFLQHYTRWAPFSTDYSFAFDTSHTKVSSFSLQVAGPELPSLVKPFLSLLLALVPASDYGNYQVEGPFEYIQRNRERERKQTELRVTVCTERSPSEGEAAIAGLFSCKCTFTLSEKRNGPRTEAA